MTTEQKEAFAALESMIARRIANTGETREQALEHISTYLKGRVA